MTLSLQFLSYWEEGWDLVMITRGEHFHDILYVSREDQHLTNFSRRELGPGEQAQSGVGGDSCL